MGGSLKPKTISQTGDHGSQAECWTTISDLVSLDGVVVALLVPFSANLAGTDESDVDEALVLEELLKDLKGGEVGIGEQRFQPFRVRGHNERNLFPIRRISSANEL